MPLKLDVTFEKLMIHSRGRFFAKIIFVRDSEKVKQASETSLEKYEDGWKIPMIDTVEEVEHKIYISSQWKWQMISANDHPVIKLELVLYRFGNKDTPGPSDEPTDEFYKVASATRILHPQKMIFKVHNPSEDLKQRGFSVSERLHFFGEKSVGDIRVYRGSVVIHYHLKWEGKLNNPLNTTVTKPVTVTVNQSSTVRQKDVVDLDGTQSKELLQRSETQSVLKDEGKSYDTSEEVNQEKFTALVAPGDNAEKRVVSPLQSGAKTEGQNTPTDSINHNFKPENHFPSIDAVKQILPRYHALVKPPPKSTDSVMAHVPIQEPSFDGKGILSEASREGEQSTSVKTQAAAADLERPKATVLASLPCTSVNVDFSGELSDEARKSLDSHLVAVLDYQTKELDRYRVAVRRLGEDLVYLRNEVTRLETTNGQLRTKMYYTDDNVDLGNLDSSQSSDSQKIAILKKKLLVEVERNTDITERLEAVQNDLIKANEKERTYLKTQQAHQAHQALVQQLQTKLAKYNLLEKACKDQEKVIETLEKRLLAVEGGSDVVISKKGGKVVLSDPLPNRAGQLDPQTRTQELKGGLINGTNVLCREGDVLLSQSAELHERFRLLQKLERAEGRIMALEQQLLENIRQWGKEKTALQLSGIRGSLEPYHSSFGRPLTPPLPAIEPTYRLAERQPRYFGSYAQPYHSSYNYGPL